MIRVLIADDQPLIRGALRGILSHQDDVEVVAGPPTAPPPPGWPRTSTWS